MYDCCNEISHDEYFECKPDGIISDSIVQNWTQSALDCYKINCDCSICPITNGGYSFKCKMKEVIEVLLKTQGEPSSVLLEKGVIPKDAA